MLNKINGKGPKCNIEKYLFRKTETEYFGLWVTHDGIRATNRKIEAITNMNPPTSRKEVQKFIGVTNYYRDMWPRRSHALASLTRLTYIKRRFKWTKVEQYAFEK